MRCFHIAALKPSQREEGAVNKRILAERLKESDQWTRARKAAKGQISILPLTEEIGGGGKKGGDIKEEGEYELDLCRKGRQGLTSDICKDAVVRKRL